MTMQSRRVDLGGDVHYLDYGGPAGAPFIVGVHGLGGSSLNWSAIAPLLTGRYRLLAPDLAGHGLTRSLGRGTGVPANQALLHRFIEAVPGRPVILMGNSMGGMISLIEAGTSPGSVSALILVDPALPFVPVRPDPLVTALFALQATPGIGHAITASRLRRSVGRAARCRRPACGARTPAGRVRRGRPRCRRGHALGRRDRRVRARPGVPAADPLDHLSGPADPRVGRPARAGVRGSRGSQDASRLVGGHPARGRPRAAARGAARVRGRDLAVAGDNRA
jgi:pimeloyl-ACP methyl ester carboxylesterase